MGLACKYGDRICEGCGECQEPDEYICPICGEEIEDLYINNDGEIVGCEMCITEKKAWDVLEV